LATVSRTPQRQVDCALTHGYAQSPSAAPGRRRVFAELVGLIACRRSKR
jgi:hypothetical protein